MSNVKKWVFSVILAIILLEVLLRVFGINQTYSESIGHAYSSYFSWESANIYNTHTPHDTFLLDLGDFKYTYITNEIGVRERPLSAYCDSPFFKVISLGDSYTEGVGTSYDSSWPRFLEYNLRAKKSNVKMFDAGTSGDDPFFEYVLYRDKLSFCNANLVIVAVNSTDIDDFFFRGGMERFAVPGKVTNKKGPKYEFLYRYSYFARMVSVFILRQRQQLFVTNKEYEKTEQEFIKQTVNLFITFQKEMPKTSKLLVVIHPQPTECAYSKSGVNEHAYSVMMQLANTLRANNIATISLYPALLAKIHEDNMMAYTFEHDKHLNGRGYKLFADSLTSEINRIYPDILQ